MDGPGSLPASGVDFEKLSLFLAAMANPARLRLLHLLRNPLDAGEIHLQPDRVGQGRAERNLTRQGVRKHLRVLHEAGLVTFERVRREGVAVDRYVVDHAMLFAVMEEMRQVARLTPTVPVPQPMTMTARSQRRSAAASGARFVVVDGPREGQAFGLEAPSPAGGRGWVIGRQRGVAVSLDYDPFVSQEHAEVVPRAPGFELRDLRTNKNGTFLNWEALPRGGSAPLAHGDIIGVGRTHLVFQIG